MMSTQNKVSNRVADRGAPGGVGGGFVRPFRLRGTHDVAVIYFLKKFLFLFFILTLIGCAASQPCPELHGERLPSNDIDPGFYVPCRSTCSADFTNCYSDCRYP
jgi:hypothetical protein